MSERVITYVFTLLSPWSYLGHAPAIDLAGRHGARIDWRPIDLIKVFPNSGGLPLAKRHPARRAYRDVELQRWRVRRAVPLNLRPRFWPVDIGLADRTVIALVDAGRDPDAFVRRAFTALWSDDENLADPATIGRLLRDVGVDADMMTAAASDPAIAAIYETNTAAALKAGVFGAPTYILEGEPFWGQDRLDLLDDALTSGRGPFVPIS